MLASWATFRIENFNFAALTSDGSTVHLYSEIRTDELPKSADMAEEGCSKHISRRGNDSNQGRSIRVQIPAAQRTNSWKSDKTALQRQLVLPEDGRRLLIFPKLG